MRMIAEISVLEHAISCHKVFFGCIITNDWKICCIEVMFKAAAIISLAPIHFNSF